MWKATGRVEAGARRLLNGGLVSGRELTDTIGSLAVVPELLVLTGMLEVDGRKTTFCWAPAAAARTEGGTM